MHLSFTNSKKEIKRRSSDYSGTCSGYSGNCRNGAFPALWPQPLTNYPSSTHPTCPFLSLTHPHLHYPDANCPFCRDKKTIAIHSLNCHYPSFSSTADFCWWPIASPSISKQIAVCFPIFWTSRNTQFLNYQLSTNKNL